MDIFKTAEDILNEKGSEIMSVSPDATIRDALTLMCERRVGAILVRDGIDYIGIWTERDLMSNTLEEGFDASSAKIKDYMSPKVIRAQHSATLYNLMDQFLGRRIRHLLIERDKHVIGFLSVGDVIKASLQQQTEELDRMKDIAKLEYYSKWSWGDKKKK